MIRRKLTNATNGQADKPTDAKLFEAWYRTKTSLLKWGPGLQSPDRNTYQLASHAEWNLPKTGFITRSSWPITIDRTADKRACSWGASLPSSPSGNMSHHFCHGGLCYGLAWHKVMFMGNQTLFATVCPGEVKLLSQAGRNQVRSRFPLSKVHTEQALGCVGHGSRSGLLLLGLSGALTNSPYPTVINTSDITPLHYCSHLHHCCDNFRLYICQQRLRPEYLYLYFISVFTSLSKQTTIDIVVVQRRKSHSSCKIWDREAEGPGKKGKAQSWRELSCKVRTLKREMQWKRLMWALLQKAGRLLQTHPSCWSEQSTLKIPCEANERMKEDIGGGCMKETHKQRRDCQWESPSPYIKFNKIKSHPKIYQQTNFSIHMLFGLP